MKKGPLKKTHRNSKYRSLTAICRQSSIIRRAWNRRVSVSRFVAMFRRANTVALYHCVYGDTLYIDRSIANILKPLFDRPIPLKRYIEAARVNPHLAKTTASALSIMLQKQFLCTNDLKINTLRQLLDRPEGFSTLTVFLTTKCNLNCHYCQLHEEPDHRSSTAAMNFETFKQGIEVFSSSFNKGNKPKGKVQFFGGEPLLEWQQMKKMVEYIRRHERKRRFGKKGVDIQIVTNGTLLTNEMISFAKQNNLHLNISLDGPAKHHNKYRKTSNGGDTHYRVVDSIKRAIAHGVSLTVTSVLGAHNIDSLPAFIRKMHNKYNVRSYQINPIIGGGEWQQTFSPHASRKKLAALINKLLDIDGISVEPFNDFWRTYAENQPLMRALACTMGNRLVLFPTAHAAPCVEYVFHDDTPKLASFKSLCAHPTWKHLRNCWSLNDPKCYESCPLVGFCDGGEG